MTSSHCPFAPAPSGILQISGEVSALKRRGVDVLDLSLGDFDPAAFAPPPELLAGIEEALRAGKTTYPAPQGDPALREALAVLAARSYPGFDPGPEAFQVAAGVRPLLAATFRAVVAPGEVVAYAVPSWHNAQYVELVRARAASVEATPETGFQPTAERLRPLLANARLLVINSPLNPTGTALDGDSLSELGKLVLEENARRRRAGGGSLYLLFDQVYAGLTLRGPPAPGPLQVLPELAPYTVIVDGISKALAATGLRLGWCVAPEALRAPLASLISHEGAWAPTAVQAALARFLAMPDAPDAYRAAITRKLRSRIDLVLSLLRDLAREGYPVEALEPAAGIFVAARLGGGRLPDQALHRILLDQAGCAAVPFEAFGLVRQRGWFRLALASTSLARLREIAPRLRAGLEAASLRGHQSSAAAQSGWQ